MREMLHFSTVIILLSTLSFSVGQSNVSDVVITVGKNKSVTLSLPSEGERYGTIDMDPIPDGLMYSELMTLKFDNLAIFRLSLIHLIRWKKTPTNGTSGLGWSIVKIDGQKVLRRQNQSGKLAWINETSATCPYLRVNVSYLGFTRGISPTVNSTFTFGANTFAVQLNDVPADEWCDFRMQFSAFRQPANYCHTEETFYCNTSLQCLNSSARCDGKFDCDLKEDEMNCQEVTTAMLNVSPTLVVGLVVLAATAVFFTAFMVIARKRLCHLLSRDRKNFAEESHKYDYPHFRQQDLASERTMSVLIPNSTGMMKPLLSVQRSELDYSGIYSHVITESQAI